MTVQLEAFKLSIKEPNNFCLYKNIIIKITRICKSKTGVLLKGRRVTHLKPFFLKPLSSEFLKIYSTDLEKLEYGECFEFSPSDQFKKVLHLRIKNVSVFMPNIHTN